MATVAEALSELYELGKQRGYVSYTEINSFNMKSQRHQ